MTTNDSGKLNVGGVTAIKEITAILATEWTENQRDRLNACLTALVSRSGGTPIRIGARAAPSDTWQREGLSSLLGQTVGPSDGATTRDAGATCRTGA